VPLPRFWTGYLSGTNRGRVYVALDQTGDTLTATALFHDAVFGASVLTLAGALTAHQARLQILGVRGVAPVQPLDGHLTLDFSEDRTAAAGAWQTDIGTQGLCRLRVAPWGPARWVVHHAAATGAVWGRRALPGLGLVVLTGVVALALYHRVDLSLPVLLLLLVVTLLVLPRQVKGVLDTFGITRVGPVEFERQQPLPVDLRAVQQYIEAQAAFLFFETQFVVRTKLLLQIVAWDGAITLDNFAAVAAAIGVAADNVDATRTVLLASGCLALSDRLLLPTSLGYQYLGYLLNRSQQQA
jgi:hypothetical protein